MKLEQLRSVGLMTGLVLLAGACSKSTTATVTPQDAASDALPADCPNPDYLISDFTSDNGIAQLDGRQGGWYVYGDTVPTGTFTPAIPANGPYPVDLTTGNTHCSGPGSLHVKATGWTQFGAALGTDFEPSKIADGGYSVKGTYDATAFKGISFWAKAAAPIRFVQVKFTDPYTDQNSPLSMDDWCTYTAGSPFNCSPYLVKFGYGYTDDASVAVEMADFPNYINDEIDTTWKRFTVMFADTKQDPNNPGQQSPGNVLDVAHLMSMAIQVNADYSTTPQSANDFEIWLDDVAFIK
jgi:hypothetical protein